MRDKLIEIVEAIAVSQASAGGSTSPATGVTILRRNRPSGLEAVVYNPVYCLILQGRKETVVGERVVDFGAGEGLIVSHDVPVVSRITRASPANPYLAVIIQLDLTLLRSLCDELGDGGHESDAAGALAADVAAPALLDALGRYLSLAGRSDPAASVLASIAQKEVHLHLLSAPNGSMLRQFLSRDSHASRIATAIAEIRRSYRKPLVTSELAGLAGMSVSSFHQHFKSITGTTPLQYQKDLRLIEARRLLAEQRLQVGETAYEVGYASATQFSREYTRKFGGPPRSDIGRMTSAI